MPKGQSLTRYQQGIVKRYYEHADDAAIQRLSELVSEIFLVPAGKPADALWKRAETALARTAIAKERAAAVVVSRDVKALAGLVADLSPGGKLAGVPRQHQS